LSYCYLGGARMFSLPETGSLVTLRDGDAELVVAPACGARICAYRVGGRDVLRPASDEVLASAFVYGFAAFPLLPYSGPIFGDGFSYQGQFHPLARNVPNEPSATHGEGWLRPWLVLDRSESQIRLRLDYTPEAQLFPFAWRGDIVYALADGRLTAQLSLTNRDHRPMPGGMGLHPYFPKASGTVLRFDATGLWPADAPEAVERGAGPIEPGLDFREGQDVDPIVLDRCYEGWDGRATLTAPDGVTTVIEADRVFGKLQVYDAWDYPYLCIEPVTNANDGYNRAALGVPGHAVAILAPGESLSGSISIYRT
jgi:aldose 1-epimerase